MINTGTKVTCKNKTTQYEIFGIINAPIYDNQDELVGYEVTNNCNELDVYVEDYILFTDWNIEEK